MTFDLLRRILRLLWAFALTGYCAFIIVAVLAFDHEPEPRTAAALAVFTGFHFIERFFDGLDELLDDMWEELQ